MKVKMMIDEEGFVYSAEPVGNIDLPAYNAFIDGLRTKGQLAPEFEDLHTSIPKVYTLNEYLALDKLNS